MSRSLTRVFGSKVDRPRRDRTRPGVEALDRRRLLSGITLDTGVLTIEGDDAHWDYAQVSNTTPTGQVLVTLSQYFPYGDPLDVRIESTFSVADVQRIVFSGHAGNDTFINNNSIVSRAHGDGGNDRLWGGSGADDLYGDEGSDEIRGRGGNDVLYGGAGNDVLIGGTDAAIDQLDGGTGADTFGLYYSQPYDIAGAPVWLRRQRRYFAVVRDFSAGEGDTINEQRLY
jgi:Ca2+-binding RTX toxin-like protein